MPLSHPAVRCDTRMQSTIFSKATKTPCCPPPACLVLCAEPHDVIKHSPTAGLLRPAYVIFRDTQSQTIILCVRGTHSRSDMFTSLTGAMPLHVQTPHPTAILPREQG